MESNDKTTAPDSRADVDTNTAPINEAPTVDNAVEAVVVPETREAKDRRLAEELADSIDPRPGKRAPVGDTPFDQQATPAPKIDWGGMGVAFFGGIGANFFLGNLVLFLERLLGTHGIGPGVVAILTGLLVVLHLLVQVPVSIRRMLIAFWAGLLCGYAIIWFVLRPLLTSIP